MKFDEMNVEQLEARQSELVSMGLDGTTEELEERASELEAIRDELQKRANEAAKAEAERQIVAAGNDAVIKEFKMEAKKMNYEVNSPEYREAFLKNLQGKELTAENIAAAAEKVLGQISPIDDIRASAWYRNKIAPVMVKRVIENAK